MLPTDLVNEIAGLRGLLALGRKERRAVDKQALSVKISDLTVPSATRSPRDLIALQDIAGSARRMMRQSDLNAKIWMHLMATAMARMPSPPDFSGCGGIDRTASVPGLHLNPSCFLSNPEICKLPCSTSCGGSGLAGRGPLFADDPLLLPTRGIEPCQMNLLRRQRQLKRLPEPDQDITQAWKASSGPESRRRDGCVCSRRSPGSLRLAQRLAGVVMLLQGRFDTRRLYQF